MTPLTRTPRRPLVHGTRYSYLAWHCKCAECRAAHAAYTRARYATKVARDVAAGLTHPYTPHTVDDVPQPWRQDRVFGSDSKPAAPGRSWWVVDDDGFASAWQQQVPRWQGGVTPWLP